jgi:hypothetical protein
MLFCTGQAGAAGGGGLDRQAQAPAQEVRRLPPGRRRGLRMVKLRRVVVIEGVVPWEGSGSYVMSRQAGGAPGTPRGRCNA